MAQPVWTVERVFLGMLPNELDTVNTRLNEIQKLGGIITQVIPVFSIIAHSPTPADPSGRAGTYHWFNIVWHT